MNLSREPKIRRGPSNQGLTGSRSGQSGACSRHGPSCARSPQPSRQRAMAKGPRGGPGGCHRTPLPAPCPPPHGGAGQRGAVAAVGGSVESGTEARAAWGGRGAGGGGGGGGGGRRGGRGGGGGPAGRGGPGRWRGRAAGRHSAGRRGHREIEHAVHQVLPNDGVEDGGPGVAGVVRAG